MLTAAHCLFNQGRKAWVHPTSVHFVAGYARGVYKAHSQAASYERGPDFVFTDPPQPTAASHDWAVIALVEKIDLEPIKVQPNDSLPHQALGTSRIVRAGYRRDRAHVLTVQQDCSVKALPHPAPILLHSCSSVPGKSGSALLRFGGSEPEIIGILVAGSKQRERLPHSRCLRAHSLQPSQKLYPAIGSPDGGTLRPRLRCHQKRYFHKRCGRRCFSGGAPRWKA